jgi:hypothetical protein
LSPTYALIGDLAKACFATLDPYLDNIMPELIRQLTNNDPAFKSVRNNAIWAVGEISMRWTKERMGRYVEPIMRNLLPLMHPQSPSVENAVNTIGRLGINNPEITALFLPQFGRAWLYRAQGMQENDEKDSAFQGFCKTVGLYPQALNEVVSLRTTWGYVWFCLRVFFIRQYAYFLMPSDNGKILHLHSSSCLIMYDEYHANNLSVLSNFFFLIIGDCRISWTANG